MPALTMLGLYKCAQIFMPLLRAGEKMLRSAATAGGEAGEWEKGVQDILNDQVKELLKGNIDALTTKKLQAVEAPLVSFTGLVLQSLVKDVLETDDFDSVKNECSAALPHLPLHWKTFVAQGLPGAQPLTDTKFLSALQSAHEGVDSSPAVPQEWLAAFFSQWLERHVDLTIQRAGWNQKFAASVAPLIADGVSSTLAADHPVAATAFRECMLRFQTEHLKKLRQIDKRTAEISKTQKKERGKATKRHKELKSGISKVEAMLVEQTAPGRLAAYKRSLLSAFRPYQELAIDNFAAAEQAAPDIWDIFVHPACSKEHLRPEDMDAAQRETPPRMPAQDLLPLLAQDDYSRTVLLADPGMGKSTLIQSLIAQLASGRGFSGASALTGLLPVPLILRDIVPLLPQDQVENWSWNSLLNILIERYQRDEAAPPLCDSFKDHRDDFRQIIHSDAKVFFLIDGLDEIGDIVKRRQIVKCIQDGIRAVNKEARWLITSRVIGYEDAPVHIVDCKEVHEMFANAGDSLITPFDESDLRLAFNRWVEIWGRYFLEGQLVNHEDAILALNPGVFDDNKGISIRMLGRTGFTDVYSARIAQRLHLAPFDDQRQDLFTQRWFQHRHSTDYSHELMREVRAHHHNGVRIISRVPNLLCMMNILKRRSSIGCN